MINRVHHERLQQHEQSAGRKRGAGTLDQRDSEAMIERIFIAIRPQIAVRIAFVDEGQSDIDLVRIWNGRITRYLHSLCARCQHDRGDRFDFVCATVAGVEVGGIRPPEEPLIGLHWLRNRLLVSATRDRNPVDRRARRLQRDGIGRAAVVQRSSRIQ